jgi:hypothetical protein
MAVALFVGVTEFLNTPIRGWLEALLCTLQGTRFRRFLFLEEINEIFKSSHLGDALMIGSYPREAGV